MPPGSDYLLLTANDANVREFKNRFFIRGYSRHSRFQVFPLADHAQTSPHFLECLNGEIQVCEAVPRAHLRADARLALGHHGKEEADDIDAFIEERVGHLLRQSGIAEHDGDDGMLTGQEIESQLAQAGPEMRGIGPEPLPQMPAELQALLEEAH